MTERSPGAPVVVMGGSIAGLGTALFLARGGRPVLVLDRDPATGEVDHDLDPAPRRATAQSAHSHIYVARLRTLLRDRAPDVLARLLADGVEEVPLRDGLPPSLEGGLPAGHPATTDDDLVALAARRPVLERSLRAALLAEPGVEVRAGAAVTGLVLDGASTPPSVTGVELDDGTTLAASLVVDACGRRTPVAGWLASSGVTPTLAASECGITYFTRAYRRRPGAEAPPLTRGFTAGASFDRYSCLAFPGDHGTFTLTFGVLPEDRSLRGLGEASAFDAAARAIPTIAPWIDEADPIGDVASMSGLKNRVRRWAPAGRPVVLGLVAVGDAAATSNPAHSRGCTLAMVHAAATADAVLRYGPGPMAAADAGALAAELDHVLDQVLVPWVDDSIEQDAFRLARWREGAPAAPTLPEGRLANGALYGAAQVDPTAWHRFTRLQNLLDRPGEVLADPVVAELVAGLQPVRLPPTEGPTHDELADLVAEHAPGVRRRGLVASTGP